MTRRTNSFDLLRVTLAMAVLYTHSWVLTGAVDPLLDVWHNQTATIAVVAFIGISGFLVSASWWADPRMGAFALKRVLRIMPGLLVCALITALVVGPLVTTRSLGDYLSDPAVALYVLKLAVLNCFNTALPGVFEANPIAGTVNGSLWTITLEACCYLAVAVTGALGLLGRRKLLLGGLVILLVVLVAHPPPDDPYGREPTGLDLIVNALRICTAFVAGSLLWELRDRLPARRAPIVLVTLLAVAAPLPPGLHTALVVLLIPTCAVVVGRGSPGRAAALVRPGDVSYGVYIYAFPLQQILVLAFPRIAPAELLVLSAVGAYALGLASWRLVERPALRFKRRVTRSVAAAAATGAPT